MLQKSGDHQLRLVDFLPLFTFGFIHPRWLFGISEPSTVSQTNQKPHPLPASDHLECMKPVVNNGMKLPYQLVSPISEPSTVLGGWFRTTSGNSSAMRVAPGGNRQQIG